MNKLFDHTILKADATNDSITKVVNEAIEYSFKSVCVNSSNVKFVCDILKSHKTDVICCSVIGFPLGSMSTRGKVAECKYAIEDGASEIDMVLNVGLLKSKDVEGVFKDVEAVAQVCKANNVILKVILEVCLLTPSEIKESSEISLKAGADFIKTSTGFSTDGATEASVEMMVNIAKSFGDKKMVKASGGIRNGETALKYIKLGVHRLGTSATVNIYKELQGGEKKKEEGGKDSY